MQHFSQHNTIWYKTTFLHQSYTSLLTSHASLSFSHFNKKRNMLKNQFFSILRFLLNNLHLVWRTLRDIYQEIACLQNRCYLDA